MPRPTNHTALTVPASIDADLPVAPSLHGRVVLLSINHCLFLIKQRCWIGSMGLAPPPTPRLVDVLSFRKHGPGRCADCTWRSCTASVTSSLQGTIPPGLLGVRAASSRPAFRVSSVEIFFPVYGWMRSRDHSAELSALQANNPRCAQLHVTYHEPTVM